MKKQTDKYLQQFYAEIGEAVCRAFTKGFSHPNVLVDMCPDFDNMLILVFGREVYKFMTSKKGIKLWAKLNTKYEKKIKRS